MIHCKRIETWINSIKLITILIVFNINEKSNNLMRKLTLNIIEFIDYF